MTTTPPQFPPSAISSAAARQAAAAEPNARLIGVPTSLGQLRQSVILSGQVSAAGPDSVRVQTSEGEVALKIVDRRLDLAAGQNVEIEMQPGTPPRSARVVPIAQPQSQAGPAQTGQTSQSAVPNIRPEDPPRNIDVRVQPAAPAQSAEEAPLLRAQPITQTQALQRLEALARAAAPTSQNAASASPALPVSATGLPALSARLAAWLPALLSSRGALAAPSGNLAAPLTAPPAGSLQAGLSLAGAPGVPAPLASKSQAAPAPKFLPLEIATRFASPPQGLTAPAPFLAAAALKAPGFAAPSLAAPSAGQALRLQGSGDPGANPFLQPVPAADILTAPLRAGNLGALVLARDPGGFFGGATPQNAAAPAAPPGLIVQTATQKGPSYLFLALPNTGPESTGAPLSALPAPGNLISLTPVTSPAPSVTAAQTIGVAALPAALPFFLTPEAWPLMDDLHAALAQISPSLAQNFLQTIPSPASPGNVAPAALFFIAALNAGDLLPWLGDKAAEALRRAGRGNLLSRLNQEGGALGRLKTEPLTQEWRGTTLPMTWDNHIHKVAVYYKHENQGDSETAEGGGRQTRFIFDLKFDRLGPVQVDGLFRSGRLDVIVRTSAPLSLPMQVEMRRQYLSALEETNLGGDIGFQNRPEQWVTIQLARHQLGVSA